jgi:hypothetical protein
MVRGGGGPLEPRFDCPHTDRVLHAGIHRRTLRGYRAPFGTRILPSVQKLEEIVIKVYTQFPLP